MAQIKTCIMILGMHRSGTSAMTGLLAKSGISLGKELMPASKDNPKGYFENNALYDFNKKLLKFNGYSWDDLVTDIKYHELHVAELIDILQNEFGNERLIAIKDPRIIYLFSLYTEALLKLGYKIFTIILFREPIEVALSLKKRNSLSLFDSVYLWAYNFLLAEKYSREYSRILIKYNDLIANPIKELNKIAVQFQLPLMTNDITIGSFIESDLKHNNIEAERLFYLGHRTREILEQITYFDSDEQKKLYDNILNEYRSTLLNLNSINLSEKLQYNFKSQLYIGTKDVKFNELMSYTVVNKLFQEITISKLPLIERLRFDPTNRPAKISHFSCYLIDANDVEFACEVIYHNAVMMKSEVYYFETNDPQFHLSVPISNPVKFRYSFDVEDIESDAYFNAYKLLKSNLEK